MEWDKDEDTKSEWSVAGRTEGPREGLLCQISDKNLSILA